MRATRQDGSYPRPLMLRERWLDLDGEWDFAFDDLDAGRGHRWFDPSLSESENPFDRTIVVPFPPESPASGVGDTGAHPVVWYRRALPTDDMLDVTAGTRVLLHFGAVDFDARVWLDGQLLGSHSGGQTPFTFDITDELADAEGPHVLVVRAEDQPSDVDQPRGKQDWRETPRGIWYHRTTGIWQTVWAEAVPADHLVDVAWTTDVADATVHGDVSLSRVPSRPLTLDVTVRLDDEVLAEQRFAVSAVTTAVALTVAALRNGQDRARLQWSPEHPVLLDVDVVLRDADRVVDRVASYLGVREVAAEGGAFLLNAAPYSVRAVLDQGYRPGTHLATTGSGELRGEVELAKLMGFNTVRVHQKVEDPRFLFWADRLGLMVWGEIAAAYAFSPRAVGMLTAEWTERVRRDRSHPSVVAWVPVNESWGVQDIATDEAQQSFARALASLTRALDPSRPVMSNEGWEHVDSDILGIHDYTTAPQELRDRYATPAALDALRTARFGPAGRRLTLPGQERHPDAPLMITEFGGLSISTEDDEWGYAVIGSDTEYATRLQELFDAIRSSPAIAGFCYTQFKDTGQETNGLATADGAPKLSLDVLRTIVTGRKIGEQDALTSTFGWHDEPDADRTVG